MNYFGNKQDKCRGVLLYFTICLGWPWWRGSPSRLLIDWLQLICCDGCADWRAQAACSDRGSATPPREYRRIINGWRLPAISNSWILPGWRRGGLRWIAQDYWVWPATRLINIVAILSICSLVTEERRQGDHFFWIMQFMWMSDLIREDMDWSQIHWDFKRRIASFHCPED